MNLGSTVRVLLARVLACAFLIGGAAIVPGCGPSDPAGSGPAPKQTVIGPPPQANLQADAPAASSKGRRGGKQIPKSVKQTPASQ